MTPAGPAQLLIVALVVIVLFGSNKLPDVARSVGRSMRPPGMQGRVAQ